MWSDVWSSVPASRVPNPLSACNHLRFRQIAAKALGFIPANPKPKSSMISEGLDMLLRDLRVLSILVIYKNNYIYRERGAEAL